MGVFFSMGYIVGRNSPSTVATADVSSHPSNPIIVENPSKSPEPSPGPVVESKPSPVPPTVKEREKELDKEKERDKEKSKEKVIEPGPKPSVDPPSTGQTFLQVVATSRPDSELIAETLAKKGFHTTIIPGPNPSLFRVLVGPLNGAVDVAETRVRLESSGFKNSYTRKF